MEGQNGKLHAPEVNLMDFGAKPDGKTLCTEAFIAAIHELDARGGGTLHVPSGTFLTGPFSLVSNLRIFLDEDARVVFSDDISCYSIVETRWEGAEQPAFVPMLYGRGIKNVAIEGHGVIDGQGAFWWTAFRNKALIYPRPRLICFEDCEAITIKNITCLNSPAWTINPIQCRDIIIEGVNVINPPDSPNTDGINPDSCKNVRISNCHIDVGDDCIALKSGTEKSKYRVSCEDISIKNCTLSHGHGAVVIGSEMSGDVRNVEISECLFEGTDRGIRIKTRRGRGGVVEGIRVSAVKMEDVLCPIVVNAFYFCGEGGKEKHVADKNPYPVTESTPRIRDIRMKDVTASNAHMAAAFLYGLPEAPICDVVFENIEVTMARNPQEGFPAMMDGIEPMSGRGMLCWNVDNMHIHNFRIEGQEGPKFKLTHTGNVEFHD